MRKRDRESDFQTESDSQNEMFMKYFLSMKNSRWTTGLSVPWVCLRSSQNVLTFTVNWFIVMEATVPSSDKYVYSSFIAE